MITLEKIQNAARAKDFTTAESDLKIFLSQLFGFAVQRIEIRQDNLSLNSVNGIIHLEKPDSKTGDSSLFFKFHHEEKEEALKEYYNGQLLLDNHYPIDVPVYSSQEVGKQVLVYRIKNSLRLFDVCKELDSQGTTEQAEVIAAQQELDKLCCERYIATLHEAELEKLQDEPVLQLFVRRLTDDLDTQSDRLGGRYSLFYQNKECVLPDNITLNFETLGKLKWRINDLEYDTTLIEQFEKSLRCLTPEAHLLGNGKYPAVIAHGDAHNGNVWYNAGNPPSLSLFDPAFAGRNIPALLAEIKPTFHNIFAHPLWLYDAGEVDSALEVSCQVEKGKIIVRHNWELGALRSAFLESKRIYLWEPLLKTLKAQNLLPQNWQEYMRLSLFCCPTLVMNLRAHAGTAQNSHTPKTCLLGFAIALMLSAAPVNGSDTISEFFERLESAL